MKSRIILIGAVGLLVIAAVIAARRDRQVNRHRSPKTTDYHLPTPPEQVRQMLFEELQPVALANCDLRRFGEPNDGGYLMCANLLGGVKAGYSYGISGYDGWGCEISRRFHVRVHQYDCFDTRQPACPGGAMAFHPECVAGEPAEKDGRVFDTLERQIAANGDRAKNLVMKMDVEASEWDTLLQTPPEVLGRIDQLAIEFHGMAEERFLATVWKLKELFFVAHLHFNNFSCISGQAPFPGWAYEVLFVSKRLGIVDPSKPSPTSSPLDAPNNPELPDCQPSAAARAATALRIRASAPSTIR
jgi:hypothetical protein